MPGYVAVYGTLKLGQANHRLIKDNHNLRFETHAVSKEWNFTMYDGGFPIITEEPRHRVAVEIYSFEDEKDLTNLDRLEQHPTWYERKVFTFIDTLGEEVDAWMYVMPHHRHNRTQKVHEDEQNIAEWRP